MLKSLSLASAKAAVTKRGGRAASLWSECLGYDALRLMKDI
jgi:hypothetical protein